MNRLLLVLFAFVLSFYPLRAQINPNAKNILDAAIEKAKLTSVYSQKVIWDSVRSDMFAHAANAGTVADLQAAFHVLLNSLNDGQAKFVDPATGTSIAAFNENQNVTEQAKFEFRIVDGDVNYLKIVGIPDHADIQKEAEIIRNALDSLGKDESEKWIIDLRNCNGETAYPILAGLAPLLGEGQICAEIDGRYKVRKLYEIHNGNFYDDKNQVAKFRLTVPLHHQQIAVLIDKNTVGAGELVAITFKGRKNTRFFGQPTKGNVAAVTTIEISKGLAMTLSHGYYQDRRGNPYTSSVKPDVATAVEVNVLDQAIEWLQMTTPQASIASNNPR
jgi:carboxyl-terminal processing protease